MERAGASLKSVAEAEPLHNVIEVVPGVYSGSGPASEADFEALRALGVRSVLSVDGAMPDVALAESKGMGYAHVPIAYSGIEDAEREAIARAIRDLPWPIYVHCHHGKHRGPAGAAVGLVCTGEVTVEEAMGLLEAAGTSASYSGLIDAVRRSGVMGAEEIDGVAMPPAVAPVPGFVLAMAEIDRAWDHLKLLRASNWAAPQSHPDLVAPAEAGMIHDRLRGLRIAASHEWADDEVFGAMLMRSEEAALALEEALKGDSGERREAAFEAMSASCSACHGQYR